MDVITEPLEHRSENGANKAKIREISNACMTNQCIKLYFCKAHLEIELKLPYPKNIIWRFFLKRCHILKCKINANVSERVYLNVPFELFNCWNVVPSNIGEKKEVISESVLVQLRFCKLVLHVWYMESELYVI